MKAPRLASPSLLWTFAGAFLVVLVLGVLLQGLLVLAIVRPAARHWTQVQAEAMAKEAAEEISEHLQRDPVPDRSELRRVLSRFREQAGPIVLVYRDPEGRMATDFAGGRWRGRRWRERAFRDSISFESGVPPPGSPPPRPDLPWDSTRSADSALAFPAPRWRDPGERESASARPLERGGEASERILGRAPVQTPSGPAGEVIAFLPPRGALSLPTGLPRPGLLFLPVAALVAGGAGFALFRLLARRLRSLEAQAARVAAGDLSARIAEPGADEIGRLGQSLNRMTASLAQARDRLALAEGQRRRFLADVTHELSTPLTSIHGYAETLLDPKVPISPEEREAYHRHILAEAQRMDLLVRDLLDLARLEAGHSELELVELDWTDLCRQSLLRFEPRFREAGISLRWDGPGEPVLVRADGRRLEQVLDNLLVNALRYVPEGGQVTLSVQAIDSGPPGGARARLTVQDNGPGISPTDLPHVFERFYRADSARTAGGSGLGLAIVREIVLRHGGDVRAESRPEGGARLLVELPRAGYSEQERGGATGEFPRAEVAKAGSPKAGSPKVATPQGSGESDRAQAGPSA